MLSLRTATARLGATCCARWITVLRKLAITCGADPLRIRLWSSPSVTSRRWCEPFSICQCSRRSASTRAASACWRLRLVIPYTTSTDFLPFSVRSSVSSNPCFRPAHSWFFVRPLVSRSVRTSSRPCPLSTVRATLPAGAAGTS